MAAVKIILTRKTAIEHFCRSVGQFIPIISSFALYRTSGCFSWKIIYSPRTGEFTVSISVKGHNPGANNTFLTTFVCIRAHKYVNTKPVHFRSTGVNRKCTGICFCQSWPSTIPFWFKYLRTFVPFSPPFRPRGPSGPYRSFETFLGGLFFHYFTSIYTAFPSFFIQLLVQQPER